MRKCLVVSAVNLVEGGPLTVLRDCLSSAALTLPPEWKIVALVHDRHLIDIPRVHLVELPDSKRSWLRRLYYEWFGFWNLSLRLKPDLWLSLHDITPRVFARRQAVYCHNPSPFYKLSWREAWMDPQFGIFNLLYLRLYTPFIRRNRWVIVQQAWLRDVFNQIFGSLPIIVAHPSVTCGGGGLGDHQRDRVVFFYPAFPRVFKNFEVVCEAAKILHERGVVDFEVRLTLRGDENRYGKWLYKNYHDVAEVKFIGLQNRKQMENQYREAGVVIFPSKLETWGLPISEAKANNVALLVAELPYARETVGTYERVSFFDPLSASSLANLMQEIVEKNWRPMGAVMSDPQQPFTQDWGGLWHLLKEGL